MTGFIYLIGGLLGVVLISWKIQESNPILGFSIGVALMFVVTLLATDKIARDSKK
jgi:hypothetical protein